MRYDLLPSREPHEPHEEGLRHRVLDLPGDVRLVADTVSRLTGIAEDTLFAARDRRRPVAAARQLAMYLLSAGLGHQATRVAPHFNRDRTTIAHACARIEDARDRLDFDRALELIEGCLRQQRLLHQRQETCAGEGGAA